MALHLPPVLLAICDLATLQLESGSFVEEDLRPYYSHMLYSLKTTSGEGYIHVLIEHQSSVDRYMAFRLMRYAIDAMQRHLNAGHKSLPLVIPVLFYQGKRSPYPYSLTGCSYSASRSRPLRFIAMAFRWWILPLSRTKRLCNTAAWLP